MLGWHIREPTRHMQLMGLGNKHFSLQVLPVSLLMQCDHLGMGYDHAKTDTNTKLLFTKVNLSLSDMTHPSEVTVASRIPSLKAFGGPRTPAGSWPVSKTIQECPLRLRSCSLLHLCRKEGGVPMEREAPTLTGFPETTLC